MKLTFGQYLGSELSEVPADYLVWLATRPKISQQLNVKRAAKMELKKRGEAHRLPSPVRRIAA